MYISVWSSKICLNSDQFQQTFDFEKFLSKDTKSACIVTYYLFFRDNYTKLKHKRNKVQVSTFIKYSNHSNTVIF